MVRSHLDFIQNSITTMVFSRYPPFSAFQVKTQAISYLNLYNKNIARISNTVPLPKKIQPKGFKAVSFLVLKYKSKILPIEYPGDNSVTA
jgi:hypothetical protein